MLVASWCPYRLDFKFEAVTSRQRMLYKDTYFVKVWDTSVPEVCGIGECALFRGLSVDDVPEYEMSLEAACREPLTAGKNCVLSSIRFGFECALADLAGGGHHILFDTPWSRGESAIAINGLIWMGDKKLMLERINDKLNTGFKCLKLKIGGINFEDELELMTFIRRHFSKHDLELRLDANGSFKPSLALDMLNRLSEFDIHSIEQPIMKGQIREMADICRKSPIPVALDEELIGINVGNRKGELLDAINPAYIILKPSLCGGLAEADEWIDAAECRGIGWWATSALESNIGLNAIAQWVSAKRPSMVQGLGTGALYNNNIESPLTLNGELLTYDISKKWGSIPSL